MVLPPTALVNMPVRETDDSSLKNGHHPNTKDTYGRMPLSWAAEKGHEAVARQGRVPECLRTAQFHRPVADLPSLPRHDLRSSISIQNLVLIRARFVVEDVNLMLEGW
jgi:hypothetical protein